MERVKPNKKPFIILLTIAALFLVGAVLAVLLPGMLPKPECPIEITSDITTQYDSYYGEYSLRGKIKNVSDETVVIKNDGGMTITFTNSKDSFKDGWFNDYKDIELKPNEVYDFENCRWALGGGDKAPSVTSVKINIDGTTYYLKGTSSTGMMVAVVLAIFAVIFLCVAITQNKNQKNLAEQTNRLLDMCEGIDEDCVALEGMIANKNENKKAAAKSIFSVLGAVVSTIFLGAGVYKIYSGSTRKQFILGKHGLYTFDSSSNQVSTSGLVKLSKENLPVKNVYAKKKTANIESADGNVNMVLFVKNCPISVEQAVETLNNIFVIGNAPEAETTDVAVDAPAADPFEGDTSVSAAPETKEIAAADGESVDDVKPDNDDNK